MPRYAAFLRAINVSGSRITNEGLRASFEVVGFEDVSTFRASGNVIFDDETGDSVKAISERIETGLSKELGYEVPTYLRNAKQMLAIAAYEPFDAKDLKRSDGKLQVALLHSTLTAAQRKRVLAFATDADLLTIRGTELYWLPSGGMADSELDLNALAKITGPWTMRTKGTMEQIAAKWFEG
jgi:uncharacterized protein (DUF1697 family)